MSNRTNIFDDIQSHCREFQRQLKLGERPRIEDYLERVEDSAQEILFQNLLHIEIQFHTRRGSTPSSKDYRNRFPQRARVIRQAFFESTMMSQVDAETPAEQQTVLFDAPAARKLGEYELLRQIGKGGFGAVYIARHLQRGDTVALKLLPIGSDANRLHMFRNEYKKMSAINHPNLVGMQTLECDGDQWFFTMDLVEGTDFLDYVRPQGTLDETRLRNALKQLAEGVVALHSHRNRIVHRDLKPSNVMVDHDGRVQILDFGLVVEQEPHDGRTLTMTVAGTPDYMAPEQFQAEATAASDWYAVGVMLYQSLTGELPFPRQETIARKQSENAPTLSGNVHLPEDLAQLADQLLRRNASDRPSEIHIAELLSLDAPSQSSGVLPSSHGSGPSVPDDVLIGRDTQLAQLQSLQEEFWRTREPNVVWITGLSGEGKSSLAEKFLAPLRQSSEMLVLSGRCYDRESVPFKAVDVLIEALVSFLRSRPHDQVNPWLPRDIQMLARLFPTLRRVAPIESQPHVDFSHIDDRQIRYRAFFSLRELLVAISRDTPLVLFIDDLQWGDADSVQVLADLLAPPTPPAILLVGSYRSDEADQSHFLCEWKRRNEEFEGKLSGELVEVTPLTEEQCLEFVAQRVGTPVEKLLLQAHDMLADTKGNPYFLEQLIEGFNTETGQFEPVPLLDIVERKLGQLPDNARDLLNAIAIAGQAVSVEEASAVAGHDTPLFSTITHMRSERLVRLIGSGEQQFVDTYHDKIRETLLEGLGETNRRAWHVRFGDMLEEQQQISAAEIISYHGHESATTETSETERIYDMAYHFHAAGDPRSFTYQLLAGEQAMRNYALEESMLFYERAQQQLPPDASNTVRYRLHLAIGRVMLWSNLPERSLDAYEQAEKTAASPFSRARTQVGMGHVCNQLGHFDKSIEHYDRALELIGSPRSRSLIGKLLFQAKACLALFLIPPRYVQSKDDAGQQRALMQHDIFLRLSASMPEKNFISTADVCLRDSLASLQTGKEHLLAHAYASAAFLFSGYGAPLLGNQLLRLSSRIESRLNDPAIRGMFLYSSGVASYWGGNLNAAKKSLLAAMPLLERSGNTYNQMVSAHMLRHVLAFTGSASEEESVARLVLDLGQVTGNVQCTCWGWYDVASALARCGSLHEAMSHMQRSFDALTNERFNMTEAIRASTYAYVLLQASQYGAAREAALQGWKLVVKCPIDVTVFSLPVLIESIVGPTWTSPGPAPDVGVLRQLLRRAVLVYFSYPNHQPHLQRVVGRALWSLGKQNKAIRKFEKAIKLAEKKGMDYQRARSLLDLAAVKEEGREENRGEAIELLKNMESVIPYEECWLLGDQYDEEVVAFEFDLERWEREHGRVQIRCPSND